MGIKKIGKHLTAKGLLMRGKSYSNTMPAPFHVRGLEARDRTGPQPKHTRVSSCAANFKPV